MCRRDSSNPANGESRNKRLVNSNENQFVLTLVKRASSQRSGAGQVEKKIVLKTGPDECYSSAEPFSLEGEDG